jgi:glycosyltransferase involved in cell wall biosynthesis
VTPDDPAFALSDAEIQSTFLNALARMYPEFRASDLLAFRVSRVRYVLAVSTLNYSQNLPPMTTSIPGLHLVNSAHILNGTLNANETIHLAETEVPRLLTASSRPALSVVIPVYNERATVEELLQRVQAVAVEKELIIVDDGSTDGTREVLQQLAATAASSAARHGTKNDIKIFFQDTNRGKGAALRRGFQEARGDIVLVQDADLEYDPQDYYALLQPIERGHADVVYGSRFLSGPHRVLFFWHYVGNRLLTTLSNVFTNLNLSDVWTCYKAFKREVLEQIDLREERFGFEPEVTAKIAKARCRVYEVPISYHGRTYGEGKKITWKDGFKGIWCIVRYNLLP